MNTNALTSAPWFSNLEKFVEGANRLNVEYWNRNGFTHASPPVVMVQNVGRRYARIAVCEDTDNSRGKFRPSCVYCFVDLRDGSLLKGSWKAPVANGIRGNLSDPNVLDKFTNHGPKYLRG